MAEMAGCGMCELWLAAAAAASAAFVSFSHGLKPAPNIIAAH